MPLPCLKSFETFPINYGIAKDTWIEEINAAYAARAALAHDLIPFLHSNLALPCLVFSLSCLLSLWYIPFLLKWAGLSSVICKPKILTEKHFLINLYSLITFYLVLLFAHLHGLLLFFKTFSFYILFFMKLSLVSAIVLHSSIIWTLWRMALITYSHCLHIDLSFFLSSLQ